MTTENSTESIIQQYFSTTELNNNNDINTTIEKHDNVVSNEIIGIDLGTTNTCVAIWRNENLEIIPDEFGNRTIPSVIAYTSKSRYIGNDAKNQKDLNPKNVFYEVKRLIGRKINDTSVINDKEFLTYNITEGSHENILLKSDLGFSYTPEELSAIILTKAKNMANNYLKTEIKKVIVTVPAYFNDSQRQATKDACTIAGLECVRILNEPTAAALAYGLLNKSVNNKSINVIVYDLGGGTLDISLLTINNGIFEVLASVGNTHLGGADFDNRLMTYSINHFKKINNIDKLNDLNILSLHKLRKSCENAKIMLSSTTQTTIAIKNFYNDKDLLLHITRDTYNDICKDLLILCLKSLDDILQICKMDRNQIDEIILVGGMTRMNAIRENIKNFFYGKDPNCSINPDEVVAAGAAIQGYLLSHKDDPFSKSMTLLDIIPLSLGIEILDGVMNILIPRNTNIPVTKKRKYTTYTDYATNVLIKIFEGERTMTKDNFKVGEFVLEGIEPVLRGIPEIEVKFHVDINGIITVTAEDIDKQNKNGITITGNKGRLNPDEITKLIEEASINELKDKIEKNKKQLYYEIDDLCSNIIYNVNSTESKLSEIDKNMVLKDVDEILMWLRDKKFNERDDKEYKYILTKIKEKYGILILKISSNNSNNNIEGVMDINKGETTIYDDDDDEKNSNLKIFEKIENTNMGIDKLDNNEKTEIKQMKTTIIELCNNIHEIITAENFNIDIDHKNELREYIDDVLLWVHIHQNPTKNEYKMKIDEINLACDKIMDFYKEKEIFNKDTSNGYKDTLEQLCLTIKGNIECNKITLNDNYEKNFLSKIDVILNWLIEQEAQMEINKNYKIDDCEYINRIDEINKEYDKLFNNIVHISNTNSIIGNNLNNNMDDDINNIIDDNRGGTKIFF